MRPLAAILNLPWTIIGLGMALLSLPRGFSWHTRPRTLVVRVASFWWCALLPGSKGVRGMAMGNVVLLGPATEPGDLEHELVHVEQFAREPLIFPLLALIERAHHGNRYSKYENEAYTRAGNVYRGEA